MPGSDKHKTLKYSQVHLRVTFDELARLKERAANARMSVSQYMLTCTLKDIDPTKLTAIVDMRKSFVELKKIGTNINQATKAINTLIRRGGVNKREGKAAIEALEAILEELKRVILALSFIIEKGSEG